MEPDHQIHSVKGETDDRRHQASNRQTQSESTGVLPMIAECIVCEHVQYRVLEKPTGPQYERCTFRSTGITVRRVQTIDATGKYQVGKLYDIGIKLAQRQKVLSLQSE
jgi:hypothetical protein